MEHADMLVFGKIYDTQYKKVYNYISYRITNHMDTEDLVSQVFLRVLEKYDTYDPKRASMSTWIIGIAHNAVSDYFQAKRKGAAVDLYTESPNLPSGGALDDIVIKNEQNLTLMMALNTLNNRERHMIALKYGAELKGREIAKVMGLSSVNVSVTIFRSIRKLRAYFAKEGSECREIASTTGTLC